MRESSGKPARASRWLVRELDLAVLLIAAAGTSLLSLFGRLSVEHLGAVILALLAVMAFSQLRLREQVNALLKGSERDPLGRLLPEYPQDLERRRAAAKDVLLIGNALRRTSKSYSRHLRSSIGSGAKVRVLLPDPKHVKKLGMANLAREIEESLATLLENVPKGQEARLEIRLMNGFPPANFNVLDPNTSSGSVIVGYHEFEPSGEAAPILDLAPSDGEWFIRLKDEASRLWNAGTPRA